MKQVTMVALYGDKRGDLAELIRECQGQVAKAVGASFTPYDVRQIHATIIGLERRIPSRNYNANFAKHRERNVAMDFDGFVAYLRGCGHFPLEVQIGGFTNRDYSFTSDNPSSGKRLRPYERSFSVQRDKIVMMGWPIRGKPFPNPPTKYEEFVQEGRIYPPTLDIVRHVAQRFGILHHYHRLPEYVDNDLFFRLGMIRGDPPPSTAMDQLEPQMRELLSNRSPLIAEIGLDDICIAVYEDDQLPMSSTHAWSLTDPRVTGDFVAGLFE